MMAPWNWAGNGIFYYGMTLVLILASLSNLGSALHSTDTITSAGDNSRSGYQEYVYGKDFTQGSLFLIYRISIVIIISIHQWLAPLSLVFCGGRDYWGTTVDGLSKYMHKHLYIHLEKHSMFISHLRLVVLTALLVFR